MPEGDTVHRAARRLQALVGQELDVETPHPRAAVKQLAPVLGGRRLESVHAVGKNLLLRFEGGVVLRNHMRMTGRWRVLPIDAQIYGTPWLVLRGERHAGVLSGGAVLELERSQPLRVGPDILAEPPDFDAMLRNLRAVEQTREVGDALLAQYLVAGIGNVWKVESLWAVGISPWAALADVTDDDLRAVLERAHRLMKASLDGELVRRRVYRRKGHRCPRCGTAIRSWPQGEGARMAYWCPRCQRGKEPPAK